jgi:ABC-type Mn2+/Zn2+ transport system ATPase subunit
MDIVIKNCNSVDQANVTIEAGKLNIKYGPNGTGKSTLARAIFLNATARADLPQLKPFKHRGSDPKDEFNPIIEGADDFKSVVVFNEDYVNQFVFKQDEVVKNSFEIFVKNSDYEQKMAEIEGLVSEIKNAFTNDNNIDQVFKDLNDLSESFGKSQSGLSKAGRIGKGIGNGNKIEHIPVRLNPYASFIKSESNVKWIKWQIEGNEFLNISTDCPYCTSPTEEMKETILAVGEEYDAKAIEHLNALQGILSRLGKYFSQEVIQSLSKIVTNKDGLKKEETNYLIGLKSQVDTLREKLSDIKSISFFSLRDVDAVQKRISNLKIELDLLPCLNSDETKAIVDRVNDSLESVLKKAGVLQGEVNKQKKGIESAIKKHKEEINSFLRYAGYKYVVDIQAENDVYKMKLRHIDFAENIQNGAMHLSYGEKNAFAIVLFMYECLTKNPDLIILDDPISSFDKSKKFAILQMLFRGKESFQGKTALMFTHDIEPIIDMVKSLGHTFQPMPVACFLKSKSGVLNELAILKSDISSFAQICDENIQKVHDDIIKVIYLRRHYEIINNKGFEYHLLSNLLHKRAVPLFKDDAGERKMSAHEIQDAVNSIKQSLPSFDYEGLLSRLTDKAVMTAAYEATENNYEKLQLFRVINDDNHENDVVKKYINEAFHIENEYIMQLNPHKYDFIPEHIVAECDRFVLNGE